jgi:hypothetical protein
VPLLDDGNMALASALANFLSRLLTKKHYKMAIHKVLIPLAFRDLGLLQLT